MNDEEHIASVPSLTPRRRSRLLSGATIVVVLAVGGSFLAFAPAWFDSKSLERVDPEAVISEHSFADFVLPPIDMETEDWLGRMQRTVIGDPAYGTVAISRDRRTVTITWYGEPSETLSALIAAAPATVSVAIQPAAFPPDELNELATRAVTTPELVPGVQVARGGMENDGSGINIGIVELPEERSLADIGAEFALALGRPDVPVTVEVSGANFLIGG